MRTKQIIITLAMAFALILAMTVLQGAVATYVGISWDFTEVWQFPAVGSTYCLPILRSIDSTSQVAITMPAWLNDIS